VGASGALFFFVLRKPKPNVEVTLVRPAETPPPLVDSALRPVVTPASAEPTAVATAPSASSAPSAQPGVQRSPPVAPKPAPTSPGPGPLPAPSAAPKPPAPAPKPPSQNNSDDPKYL